MKKQQISNLNAGQSVITVLARHHDALPEAVQEGHDELVELTDKIMGNGRQQVSRTGLGPQKNQLLNELAEAATTLAGALCSYGTKIGDDRLVAACGYSRSNIVAGRDAAFAARCSDLVVEATPLVDKLGKFKVTAATLKDLKARIEAFDAVRTSPRDAIAKSSAATKRLPKLFRKVRVLLTRRLDPLIAPFKESNPELFSEYQTARKLVHLPTKEKSTKAAVKPESATTKAKPAATSAPDKSKVA